MPILGAHLLLYSARPELDRAFLRDVLAFPAVDAGDGWLIYRLPRTELGVHPAADEGAPLDLELYLMCDDLEQTLDSLAAAGVVAAPPQEAPWGSVTRLSLPSGGAIGLYQPKHPSALDLPEPGAAPR